MAGLLNKMYLDGVLARMWYARVAERKWEGTHAVAGTSASPAAAGIITFEEADDSWTDESGQSLAYIKRMSERQLPDEPLEPKPKPKPPGKPSKINVNAGVDADDLKLYSELADKLGFSPPELLSARFKGFLDEHDWPVYALDEVVKYMDHVSLRDSEKATNYGWHWIPLRAKDNASLFFGTASYQGRNSNTRTSDYYAPKNVFYSRLVPAHALKKIVEIEAWMRKTLGLDALTNPPIKFMISDYQSHPNVVQNPDPFLMAVITATERYVIDLWDEPGFGIQSRVK